MKVLEKGQWRHSFECQECRAILMTEESDYKTRTVSATNSHGQTGGEVQIYCECSECETEYVLDHKDVSVEVRQRILNRPPKPRPPLVIPGRV